MAKKDMIWMSRDHAIHQEIWMRHMEPVALWCGWDTPKEVKERMHREAMERIDKEYAEYLKSKDEQQKNQPGNKERDSLVGSASTIQGLQLPKA